MKVSRAIILVSVLILFFLYFRLNANLGNEKKIILLTNNRGLLISQDGDSWRSFNKGLPEKFVPKKIKSDNRGNFYLITLSSGIFSLNRKDSYWKSISSRDFLLQGKNYGPREYRQISAFAINTDYPNQLALATKHTIYLSSDSGKNWSKLNQRGMHKRNYITSLCISGKKPVIYAGTSFKGIFMRKHGRFINISRGLPAEPYSSKVSFPEEISSIYYSAKNFLIGGCSFGKGVYYRPKGRWLNLKIPINNDYFKIHDIADMDNSIYVTTDEGIYALNLNKINSKGSGNKDSRNKPKWKRLDFKKIKSKLPPGYEPLALYFINNDNMPNLLYHVKKSNDPCKSKKNKYINRKGIYASVPLVRRRLKSLVRTIKSSDLNSIVIDIKD
ncbi:hypothetical protein ACFL20_12970, partial [Spirochaetota bacterium]